MITFDPNSFPYFNSIETIMYLVKPGVVSLAFHAINNSLEIPTEIRQHSVFKKSKIMHNMTPQLICQSNTMNKDFRGLALNECTALNAVQKLPCT